MKKLILFCLLSTLVVVISAFAASGDKTTTFGVATGTPANSTAASKVNGELKKDGSYLYVNISSAARPHWRRIAVGSAF